MKPKFNKFYSFDPKLFKERFNFKNFKSDRF